MDKKRIALILSLFALGLTACGGDDEEDEATTIPTIPLSVPGSEATLDEDDDEATTGTVVEPDPAPAPAPAPAPEPAPAPDQVPDSPENDTPPPPGSPAEQFENFCEQNPGAC